jgi:hypothetical protein
VITPTESFLFGCSASKDQEKWIESLINAGVIYQSSEIALQYNSIYEMTARLLSGEEISLSQFQNQVLVVVNVASE